MATIFVSPVTDTATQQELHRGHRRYVLRLVSVLTFLAVLVHGYHPYAEDGGLYLAGIKHLLDPQLFPHDTAFVAEHLRFSIFAPVIAAIVRWSGLTVATALFLLYIASFWATLYAAWQIAARCYEERIARTAAVALLATWITLPVAGTSLMLMDPYVTARSISTPCALFALSGTLTLLDENARERKRGLLLTAGALAVAFLFHPLMAAYALCCVLVLAAVLVFRAYWVRVAAFAVGGAIVMAGALQTFSGTESAAYIRVAMTRSYWFLSQWRWYELVGLAAPLALLSIDALRPRVCASRCALARALLVMGLAAVSVSLLLVHVDSASHFVARLQPLRVFLLVYVAMILFVGATIAKYFLKHNPVCWVTMFSVLAGVMLFAERQTFPASTHLELPNRAGQYQERNPWARAFLWVRSNTPKDALLALDADYIERPNEDAQCFRAISERSALPDYSKDGGEASITPVLTTDWAIGQAAQTGLSEKTDQQRIDRLTPLGVEWVVLEKSAVTGFTCDYANEAVKVCRLPSEQDGALASSRSQPLRPPAPR